MWLLDKNLHREKKHNTEMKKENITDGFEQELIVSFVRNLMLLHGMD